MNSTMVIKSTTKVSTNHQDKNDEQTAAMLNDEGNKNSSDLTLKTGYQRPSSREDIDNSFLTAQTFWERLFSWRSFIIVLLHLSHVINMLPVVTMSISLICMCGPIRRQTNDTLNNSTLPSTSTYQFTKLENIKMAQEKVYEFNWGSETRGLLISGYLFTFFLAPQLCNIVRSYIGNKLTLTMFSLSSAFLSFMSPIAARTSVYFFLAIRIASGLCMIVNSPIAADTLAWWIPAKEKLTSTTIVISGMIVGGSVGSLIASYFCEIGVDNGWPLIFYFQGVIAVLWTIPWCILSSRKPENHSYISEKEKTYILAGRVGMNHASTQGADSTPYRTILTSRPVLVYFGISALHLWAMIIYFTCLPLYLSSVLKFSLSETGGVFSVIFISRLPGAFLWSTFGNWLRDRRHMSTNKVRKVCFGLGQGLAAVFGFGLFFLDESYKWLASVMLGAAINSANSGFIVIGVIPLDMAPRYAGFILGLRSSLSSLVSATAPLIATTITNQGSFEQWRVVWIYIALVNLTSGLVFLIFGNASLQSWAVSEIVPTIVKVNDQSSSDLKLSNASTAATLRHHKPQM